MCIARAAIVLPEQSVATNKEGLAVSKKGLTLKELLQQTSHHNAKVRRDALMGIKDLVLNHPAELRLHRYAVIEKLRERISDDDKVVREACSRDAPDQMGLAQKCLKDNQGLLISLLMTYIFNAMTNLAIDIRMMAFKFFDLVVQYYPPCFSLYAEKILQSYEDILRKNQYYLEDKGKLRTTLSGLVRCLSLLPSKKPESEKGISGDRMIHAFEPDAPTANSGFSTIIKKLKDLVLVLINCFQDFIPLLISMPQLDAQSFDCILSILQSIDIAEDDRYFILNIVITEIFLHLREWICPSANVFEKFLEFIENALLGTVGFLKPSCIPLSGFDSTYEFLRFKRLSIVPTVVSYWKSDTDLWRIKPQKLAIEAREPSSTRSGKVAWEKHVPSLLPFIPKLASEVETRWQLRILESFTQTFKGCNPESSLKLACLSMIEEMLIPNGDKHYTEASDTVVLDFQTVWIRELPSLLMLLGDRQPSSSQVVLRLLLRLGQFSGSNSFLFWDYENTQFALSELYSTCEEGNIYYGPFMRLPRDCQELSICCLYYFSNLSALLLKSVALCCLCPELELFVSFRIIEVLHAAYKAGHIQIADHISFFMTLLSRFKVFPENIDPVRESDVKVSNHGAFKSLTSVLCSYLSQMGDSSVVLQILDQAIIGLILLQPPLDNACAMLRVLIVLDSKPTRLSEQSIIALSNFLPGYLMDVVHCIPEDDVRTWRYYLLPCFFLFDRSNKSSEVKMTLEERHRFQCSFEQLKVVTSTSPAG
ncbi:hypothetical protein Godav_015799 [Gossypium davidsonii]|uniref:Pre-rRNA-processing protein Ipi1 N-terminal domain-containing protein n=1 Tax=Gossypium davidsonii TaxID=34287 RepID=A0A7J8RQ62_GOSDV|nr:hypothetical protein [Gossypium davidsonii]